MIVIVHSLDSLSVILNCTSKTSYFQDSCRSLKLNFLVMIKAWDSFFVKDQLMNEQIIYIWLSLFQQFVYSFPAAMLVYTQEL